MASYLPEFGGMSTALRGGRSVYEGYQRGWGLEFGNLRRDIGNDPDYREALICAEGRSVTSLDRLMNVFLLIKFYLPQVAFGHIIEYGSYRGGSAFFMAALARKFLPGVRVYALDTFSGMPATDKSVDAHNAGDFADVKIEEILRTKKELGLDNVHFVKGLFAQTAPDVLADAGSIALAHIDCDVYDAVKYSYETTKSYMVPMGYIVFDDATASSCIGATEVVEEVVIQRDRPL